MSIPGAINQHEGHEATCLCCVHCESGDDQGYSSMTPGMGPYITCERGVFFMVSPDEFHKIIHKGRLCELFEGRKS